MTHKDSPAVARLLEPTRIFDIDRRTSPFTVILWDDDCEQHTVHVNASGPTTAAILARISQARMDNRPLVEVDAIAVISGHGECFTELSVANCYSGEGGDEGEDEA